jgi:hypothetical protein
MSYFLIGLFMLLSLWALPAHAQAASVSIAWTYNVTPPLKQTGFQVLRCQMTAGAPSCIPSADLPGGSTPPTVLTFTDTTVVEGNGYCWTAVALGPGGRSDPATTTAGTSYICKTVLPPRPPAPTGLREVP